MKKRINHEENVHSERWLVSYADFMTLMFALFVVLFASAYHDKKAIQRVSTAVKSGFQEMGAFSGSNGSQEKSTSVRSGLDSSVNSAGNEGASLNAQPAGSGIDVAELHRKLNQALGK